MKNFLIAYYSFSGNTRSVAKKITEQVSGELLEIIPAKLYTFDYNTASKEVRAEISRGFCPKLNEGNEPIDKYDTIFIGTPNWFKSIAPPVLTFLREHNFAKKTLVPFCTHGGGGFGDIELRIAEECPNANILPGLAMTPETEPEQMTAWLRRIGLFS